MDWMTIFNSDFMKTISYVIIYPVLVAYLTLQIAKFHFQKDRKIEYLKAKDEVARNIINQLCTMLLAMWEIVNCDRRVAAGTPNSPELVQRRRQAVINFQTSGSASYLLLGLMGLYYGYKIVDLIAQLQSDLNHMVNTNEFSAFDDWDNFRKKRLLPILNRAHKDLKYTVFDRPFWDWR